MRYSSSRAGWGARVSDFLIRIHKAMATAQGKLVLSGLVIPFLILSLTALGPKGEEPDGNSSPELKVGHKPGQKRPGSISGRVTIQGRPAQGLELELRPAADLRMGDAIAGATTDEQGRYG